MNKLDQVSSHYKPGADTELENNLMLTWYPKRILKRLEGTEASSILELGVGHGLTARYFNQYFNRHVIIEGSPVVIDLFKKKNKIDVEVVQTYFEKYSTKEKFDVILMGFILEHVDDPGLILERYKEFLAPGGQIFIAVPNAKSLNRRLGLELEMIDDIYELNANDLEQGHKRQFCRNTLKDLIVSHGYKITWEEGIYLKPLPIGFMQNLPRYRDNLEAMLKVGVEFPDLCVGLLVGAKV